MLSKPAARAVPTAPSGPEDAARVVGWRFHQLLTSELDMVQALELAEDQGVDVHELVELVGRGCPPELAARIVAPLGAPRG
jgi:hypothetical protein